MLLPGNGTNGGQNNTFLDSSTNNFTITRNGNTTQGTFSPYGSNWSNYFNGSTDYFTTPASSSFQFGTGNFTIEYWLYTTNFDVAPVAQSFNSGGSAIQPYITSSGQFELYIGGTAYYSSSGIVSKNTWQHIAIVRNSNTITFYVNGVAGGSVTHTGSAGDNAAFGIGARANASYKVNGYLSNVRITNTAVYTSAFTPSTTPFTAIAGTVLLTCQSNRFIDNSTNAFTITVNGTPSVQRFSPFSPTASYAAATIGGSGYFDGTGDNLRAANNAAFDFGTNSLTAEAWVYLTAYPSVYANILVQDQNSGTAGSALTLGVNPSGQATWYAAPSVGEYAVSLAAGTIPLNTWTHVAGVRNGNTWTLYVNGLSVASTTSSVTITQGSSPFGGLCVGGSNAYGYYISGFIAGARMVNGSAVYTSNFTPPTSPLTAITNTSLLTNFTNASIIDNAMMNDLETVGNAQISTSVSKFGGGSMAFDGTGDYLDTQSVLAAEFGSGDFTIEFWLNASGGIGTTQTVISKGIAGSAANDIWTIEGSSGGNLTFYAAPSLTPYVATTTQPWTSGWAHIAISRSGSNTRMFVNGVQSGSTYTTLTTFSTGGFIRIGSSTFNATRTMTGYIDDLRITKGYARYTSNFTAPTAAFPTF
jgi:hypothetical protein